MSEENQEVHAEAIPSVSKKPLISLPFIIVIALLAVGAYLAGPWFMTMVLYQQEKVKAGRVVDLTGNPEERGRPSVSAGGGMADGGGGGGGGRGRGAGFDPEAVFAERDADGNGKLEGEEIQGRMQDSLDSIDTDQDGAVTKEEFLTAMQNFRGGGRRGRGDAEDGGGGDRASGRPASESDGAQEAETSTEGETDEDSGEGTSN